MPTDLFGLPVSTTSSLALERYDRGVVGLLSWGRDALDHFRVAAEHDPGLALAHAGAAVSLFLNDTLLEACFRGERLDLVERLLAERLARRRDHYWSRRRTEPPARL
jgi:hypothetical protein